VAALFDVSVASVVKWSQRQRATGSAAARPMGGHRKRLLEPHRELVIERLKAVPDLTLKALVAELAERGIATCPVSVWRLVRSEGMSFKKKPVRHRAGAPKDRAAPGAVEEVSGAA
jgi:transposase